MSAVVRFSIPGRPVAAARPRAAGGRVFTPPGQREAKSAVAGAFLDQVGPIWTPWEGPVTLTVRVYVLAPKSAWPGKTCLRRPDCDNYLKLVADALNGVAYRDDAQVHMAAVSKQFGTIEQTFVELAFEIDPPKPTKTRRNEATRAN